MKTKQSRTIAAIHLLSAWLGLAAWLGWGAAPVSAILAINFNGESGNAGAVFANGVGTVFTVGSQNLVVTNLGATGWCSDWNNTTHSSANLNASPVTVKLWRVSDGALLASATLNSANWSQTWFPSGAAYMMPYLTAPANVLLTSNVQHIIALYGTGNANLQYINSLDTAAIKPVVATSYITFNDNRRASAGGYIMLDTSDGGTSVRYGGPTFEFTTPATQYFSGTSATAWDTTTTDWGTTSGGAYNVVWGGPFNTAVFEGTPNIVTMGAAMNAAAVTLNVSGYVFDTAAFNPTWGPVGGSGSLTKAGSGTLSLSSSNSYSGATTISNGTLNLASAASTTAKTTAGGGNSTYGGSLGYNFTVGANPIYITKLGFWDQGQNGLGASHVVNISTTGGSLVASATVTTAEPLSGEYRFVTLGTPVQLAANTTYRIWSQGYTIDAYNPGASAGVDAGVTGVTFATGSFYKDAGGMPDSADTTVYRTTTFAFALSLASLPPATALNVAGSGATCNLSGLNATVGSLAGVTGSSLLLGAGLLTVGDATSTSFAGLISGTGGSLVKNGNGTFTLSSSNGYTGGTTIRSGAVNVQNGYGLGTAGSVVVSNAAELQLQGGLTTPALALSLNGTGTNSSGALRNISGGNTYAGAITLAGPTRINSDADSLSLSGALAAGAYTLAFGGAGDINMNNSISGTAGLTKDGAGTLSLNGNYGGPVTVNSGTMALVGNYNRLMASPSITVNNGATLTCPSYAQNFNQLHLTGGTLAGTGDGTYGSWLIGTNVIVNGGTNTSTISATAVTIKTPGVVFNVSPGAISGIDLDVPGTIVHIAVNPDNSLIKAGAGVMRLSGNNTYLASTIVSNGTLALSGSGSIASSASIVVNAGAVLDASARTDGTLTLGGAQTLLGVGVVKGTVTVGAGSSLSPATNGVVGTLNFSNQLNLTGGSSYYDLANVTDVGANDRMVVAGDLNLTGTNRIFVNKLQGVLTTGSYPLFTYGGALNGGATNFQLIGAGGGLSRQTVSIDTSVNNVVALNVVGSVGSLLWTAANGNVWDIVTTTNWINLNQAGAPDVFYDTDFVAFDDSAATGNVSVGVPVLVDLLAINNTNLAYTFSGAGKIGGKAGLNKSGPGALNITLAANDFAGTNYLNGGTVTVSALASNGLPSSLGTNANIVFNGGSLNYTGPSLNINRTLALNSGATLGVADSAAKLTVNSALTGNGGLTKAGLGTLALSQLNTYTGGTVVEAGTLELNKMFNSDTAMLSPTTNLVVKNSGTVRFTGTNYNVLGARAGRITDLTVEAGGLVSADSTTNNGHHLLHPILKGGTLAAANTNHNGFGNFILYTNNLVTATADEASTISADLGLSMPAVFDVADGPAPADLTISGAVLTTPDAIAPGGIVKSNTGTLLLTGASRYAGATTVGAGTLALGAGGAISNSAIITVASGAAIDVSAVNGGFNLNTNQTLAGSGVVLGHVTANSNSAILPGGSLVAGTLSLSNNLVLNTGSKLNFDLANSAVPSASDLLVVGGDLVLAGVATINISRPDIFLVEGGHYTIIRYSGALVGDVPSSFLITPDFTRYNYTLNTNTPGEIRVYVTPAASLTWKGDGTTNVWDIATTSNWLNGVNLDKFFQLDHVLFDNSGFTNPAIALTGALWPTSVTVSASQNYTFGGSGSLNGPMTLTKDGSGTLTINNANAYTGATFINGGTLKAGNALALGATNGGTFIGLGGALDIGGQNLGFEAVTAQGDGVGGYGAILNTGAGQINALRRLTLAGDTTIASPVRWDVRGTSTTVIDAVVNGGGFNLTKTSSNELWFVFATISNLADIHVLQGPFGVADCLGLGDPDKNLFVHPGASLYLYSHDAVADAYTKNYFVTNGTVSVSGGVGSSILNGTMTLVGSCSLLNEMTINAPIGGPGSLTRGGGGRLTLNAANSYSGPTTITGGTLALGAGATLGATPLIQINGGTAFDVSALAGGFTLASGQTLAGSGSVTGAVADASGSFIVPGGSNAIGTLTLASNLTLNGGGSLVFDLSTVTNEGGAFNDLLNVRDLTLHGVTTIKLSGAFLNPTSPYTLINYSGALTGAGSLSITSDTRYVLAPDFSVAGKVRVSVIGGGALNLNWVGDWVGSNPRADWDVRLSPYWDTGMSTELFFHGDRVTFGDDGVYSHDVNLATALLPGSLLVNNTYDNYTFLGSGGIASATALVKDGPAALILLTTNTYTGGTLINNGTLQLGNGLVNGSITGNITNNALLAFVPATSNSFAGWITGTGRLLKSGPGTLTLTANNTYSGGTTVEGGELATSGYLYTAQGTGPLLISPGATFRASATHCLTAMTSPITNRGTMLLNGYHRPTSPLYLDGGTFCTIGGFSAGWQGFHFLIPVTTLANAAPSIITNTGVNSGLHIRAATAGGTTFTVEDGSAPQDLIVSATLLNPTDDEPGLGKLIKAGPGLMAFNGTATFSGGIQVNNGTFEINGLIANAANTVTVAGGTLGGTGLVASAVSIQAAGTLAPGASIGTLTISNTLTLAGQTVMEIDRAAAQTSDKVVGLTTVTYGGTLTVTNVGGALAAGDSFKLFDATNYTGDFAAFQLPELASAQTWDTSKLKVDGTLRVAQLLAISGQVALEAFTGPARNGAGSRPVTFVASKVEGAVTTYLATNEVTLTFAAGPDGYGVAGFALVNLPLGVTHLSAKAPLNLRQKLLVFFTGANGTADFTGAYKLPGGDLDGSNFVDIVDYFQLAALWYQLAPAGSPADIDGSGLVDIDDYFILASHWYEAGSPE